MFMIYKFCKSNFLKNFDKFFDPKEPVYKIFRPIPEHSKITVFLFNYAPNALILKSLKKFCDLFDIEKCFIFFVKYRMIKSNLQTTYFIFRR